MMNNHKVKCMTYLMVIVFVYNYLSSVWVGYLNNFLPAAYNINTARISSLLTYLEKNIWQYVISILGYFSIFLILVVMLVFIVLLTNDKLTASNIRHGLSNQRVYLVTVLLLLFLLPLNQIGLKIPIVNYITVPTTFIAMVSGPLKNIIFWSSYVIVMLFVLKLKYVFYYLLIENDNLKKAIRKSWDASHHTTVRNVKIVILFVLQLIIAVTFVAALQYIFDELRIFRVSILTANVLMSLLAGVIYFLTAEVILLFTSSPKKIEKKNKSVSEYVFSVILLIIVGFSSVALAGRLLAKPASDYLVIAHMGISSKKDVPNSIKSLAKTHLTKPDYVEIDIQKTKDGQYVLSHDSTIESVTGKKFKISDTSWKRLREVKFISSGHKVYLTNFRTYLKKANQLNQKILVELKINSTINNNELQKLIDKYGKDMQKNHTQIQSLNQNSLTRLNKYTNITLGLLSPVNNLINNSKKNQFYSIEFSSLSPQTTKKAHKFGKKIYAWTVNTDSDITTMYAYGVDGFITDTPATTREYLKKVAKQPQYAKVVWNGLLFKRSNF
ncbi:hypothetical protein LB941_11085 [Ligilactobacillus sp. WILCCON 0076]|uniref:GP-PDE domain-containing protein n=1 Tax=Ligilactobacillus ubinensis TaxID=2876789 RepID=A0A9X2FRH6_9LACO|nr:glycerophosphodiester phosphodiesterase family protein [Ligilactobacillus ubinensis]MCP0887873.1 hypothetical protein [Ligilactobacillus ubinensis]